MNKAIHFLKRRAAFTLAAVLAAAVALPAAAYDGTKCKAAGNCWEPKPGYPEKIAGSKYDPKHDPAEINKQSSALKAMEERNRKRAEHFKKTGKWVYDVSKANERDIDNKEWPQISII